MYNIEYHEDVKKDFKELGHATTILVLKKIQKLSSNPNMGQELGNKANSNLAGLRKLYVDNKKIRIVYKIIDKAIKVFIVAVGKRDNMQVYKKAAKRI